MESERAGCPDCIAAAGEMMRTKIVTCPRCGHDFGVPPSLSAAGGPLGPHGFLMYPSGKPECFRALNRDGRSPRCGKPYDDPIHQVAAGEPAVPSWWCGICSPNFLDNDGGCDDCAAKRADQENEDPTHQMPSPTFRKSDSTRPSGGQR